jgi:two-component system cell cycle sensor histidine kinase PleC
VHFGIARFEQANLKTPDERTAQSWFQRVLAYNLAMSTAWGVVPWLLWDSGNTANHLFIQFVVLSIIARFLVSRAGHIDFFTASFCPMALLLAGRLFLEGGLPCLTLAALVGTYGLHVSLDARRHAVRIDTHAELRFANQDLAHALEQARDEALRKRSEAEEANASKTSFLANMSHELRTPLNAILGFSEIIARECLGPIGSPRYKEYAEDIHNSGAHLLSLINELLDVAKIESGKMQIEPNLLDSRRALENTLKLIGMRARERNQTLSMEIAPDADMIYADERAFKQVVINLASNAVKFTQEGGRIDVIASSTADGDFQLLVADNGPGIPRERVDDVFKPFSQIDNRYDREEKGTGLGLALVRGLVALHGGRAWIDSDTGQGTRAYVVFPKGKPAARAVA